MLRRLYDWTIALAESPGALTALAVVSFIESSIFPIPPHVMLIPMVIARPRDWVKIALVCSLASVAGGAAGYALGLFAFESVAKPILALYGYEAKFADLAARYNEFGAEAVLIAGLTPFPFKIITILSGATGLDFATFLAVSIVARFTVFFVMAALLWKLGPPVRVFIEKRLGLMFTLFVVLLLGGFAVAKWLA